MKTRLPVQLSLTLLSDVIDEFVVMVGATPTGKALVPIFGIGDEEDNWEALHHFLSSQDGRRVATHTQLIQLLHQRIQTQMDLMCRPVLPQEAGPDYSSKETGAAASTGKENSNPSAAADQGCSQDTPPVGTLSHSECQALAMAMVFLSERLVRQETAQWMGKPKGLLMLEHVRGWSRKALYGYCLAQIEKGDLEFHHAPAELLPALANSFYHKSLMPWLRKGIAPPRC